METLVEKPVEPVNDKLIEIKALLAHLEKYAVGETEEDPLAELHQAKDLLDQAQLSGIDVMMEKGKFIQAVSHYYGKKTGQIFANLSVTVGHDHEEACSLIFQSSQLIREAKDLGLDISAGFQQIKNIFAQAESAGLDISQEKAKLVDDVATYYNNEINTSLSRLADKVKAGKPEAYLSMSHIDQLIQEAKGFGIDMSNARKTLDGLEKTTRDTIKV